MILRRTGVTTTRCIGTFCIGPITKTLRSKPPFPVATLSSFPLVPLLASSLQLHLHHCSVGWDNNTKLALVSEGMQFGPGTRYEEIIPAPANRTVCHSYRESFVPADQVIDRRAVRLWILLWKTNRISSKSNCCCWASLSRKARRPPHSLHCRRLPHSHKRRPPLTAACS